MRRDSSHLFPLISILLLFSTLSYGQAWSGILSTNRAIDWSHAGLQATFPDGETTAAPWTPPTRTAICVTLNPSGGDDTTQIVNAVSACPTGEVVLLGGSIASPKTFTISSFMRLSPGYTSGHNNVTVRGGGPMATTVNLSGSSANIQIGAGQVAGSAPLTSAPTNYTVGNTSVIVTTGSPPAVGNLASFSQCDTGFSGSPCTGTSTDNGGLFVCSFNTTCDFSGGSGNNQSQQQMVLVTSVSNNGNGTYTVGFTPGLYMPNWAFAQTATLTWYSSTYTAIGMGLEDMTITLQNSQNQQVSINGAYNSWIKGVRIVGSGVNEAATFSATKNCLFFNNYIFAQTPSAMGSANQISFGQGNDSDDLILNNIITGGVPVEGEGLDSGVVIAYNFNRDSQTNYYQDSSFQHHGEASLILHEANQFGITEDDDTWGTHHLNTWFRNYFSCWDPPYLTVNPRGIEIDNYSRFENVVGNSLGSPKCVAYQGTSSSTGYIYVVSTTDALALNSMMRWGNCDTVTGTCRFQSSEVPTTLPGNAAPFENSVPLNDNLPCSFFLAGYSSPTCTPHANGGTGLSWWKVCTSWTTFPTRCAAGQTQPFPLVGPDVTGGPYVNGTAYDAPAAIAFQNLPIDPNYQNSYSITGSSWSGGTETLTVSGLPNVGHLIGGFQITGVSACNTPTGGEAVMTSSSATTVSYAMATNPGSCAGGTMKFPDVRQFDESVYQNDPGTGDPPPAPPTGLAAVVQ